VGIGWAKTKPQRAQRRISRAFFAATSGREWSGFAHPGHCRSGMSSLLGISSLLL
jgi:hypothetical protein